MSQSDGVVIVEWCVMNGKKRQSYERFLDNACSELELDIRDGKFIDARE